MMIQVSPEQEDVIRRAIETDLILDAEDVIEAGVETIRQRLADQPVRRKPADAAQWSKEFHAWVESHSRTTPLLSDDAISRESIYGTLGLQMAILTDTNILVRRLQPHHPHYWTASRAVDVLRSREETLVVTSAAS